MSEVKRCPFCGKQVGYITSIYGYRVVCDVCDIQGPRGLTPDEARNKWNRRTPDLEELAREVKELESFDGEYDEVLNLIRRKTENES